MKRRWLQLGLLLAGVIVLAVLLRGVVRQIILMPLLYAWWIARLLYRSVPQMLFWILFVVGALLILWHSLFRGEGVSSRGAGVATEGIMGSVESWTRLIQYAKDSHYSRWRLSRRLSELTQEVLIYQDQMTPTEARQAIEEGSLEAPQEVRAYLQAGRYRRYFSNFSERAYRLRWRIRRSRRRARRSPLDLDPERVVQFLEERLEVRGDD